MSTYFSWMSTIFFTQKNVSIVIWELRVCEIVQISLSARLDIKELIFSVRIVSANNDVSIEISNFQSAECCFLLKGKHFNLLSMTITISYYSD